MERAFSTALDEELRREDVSHSPACSLDPSDYRWGEDIDHHQKQALFKQFSAMAQNVAMLFYSFFPSLPLSPGCPMPPWLMQASYGQMSMGNVAPLGTTKNGPSLLFPLTHDRQSSNDSANSADGAEMAKQRVRPGYSNASNNTNSSKKRGSPAGTDQKRSQSKRNKSENEVVQIPHPQVAPAIQIKLEEAQMNVARAPVVEARVEERQDHSSASNDGEPEDDHVDYLNLAFGSFIGAGVGTIARCDGAAHDEESAAVEVPCGLLMQSHEKKAEEDALGLDLDNGWNSNAGLLDDELHCWNRQGNDFGLGI